VAVQKGGENGVYLKECVLVWMVFNTNHRCGGKMKSKEIFMEALEYEEKIRDLYRSAAEKIDDHRAQRVFNALADDEQAHVDFLHYSLEQLEKKGVIDHSRLKSSIPDTSKIDRSIQDIQVKIPENMLGDIKIVLNTALQLEKGTTAFYENAVGKTEGEIQKIFLKLLEFENNHLEVVQTELDHASNSGLWFDFMESDMEHG